MCLPKRCNPGRIGKCFGGQDFLVIYPGWENIWIGGTFFYLGSLVYFHIWCQGSSYDSVYYLRRVKNDRKHPQHHVCWGECFSPSVWMYAFLHGNITLVVFSKQCTGNIMKCHNVITGTVIFADHPTDNCSKHHNSITGTVTLLITVPVIFQSWGSSNVHVGVYRIM